MKINKYTEQEINMIPGTLLRWYALKNILKSLVVGRKIKL